MPKVVVALDVNERERLNSILKEIEGEDVWVKVGLEAVCSFGLDIVKELKEKGFKVFADMKLHDIPNTVESAARVIVRNGADMLNVHCTGGKTMCEFAVRGVKEEAEKLGIKKPLILGVTALTSMGPEDFGAIGMRGTAREIVIRLATLGKESGLDGIISSANEIRVVREYFGKDFVILTPGIRPQNGSIDDQKRVSTPTEAVKAGADYLVIGRPITASENPKDSLRKILNEINEACKA